MAPAVITGDAQAVPAQVPVLVSSRGSKSSCFQVSEETMAIAMPVTHSVHIPARPAEESSILGAVVPPSPPARRCSPLQAPHADSLCPTCSSCPRVTPRRTSAAGTLGSLGARVFEQAQSSSQGGAGSGRARGQLALLPALPALMQAGDCPWLTWSTGMGCPSKREAAASPCPSQCKQGSLNVNLDVEVLPY